MIFKRELLKSQKSLWIWTVILGGMIYVMVSVLYPEFAEKQGDLNKLLEAYPESVLKAFNVDRLDLTTVMGFYAAEGYLLVTLVGSIYAVILASHILSKEENDKTVEFLLSKPITRTRVVTEKLLVVLTNLVLFNGVIAAVNWLAFQSADDDSVAGKTFFLISVAPFLLHLTFASVSFMISTMLRKSRTVLSVSLGIVMLTYFLDMIQGISDKLDNLKYFTPFEYVNASTIVLDKKIDPLYLAVMFITIVLSTAAAYAVYRKKDITA